MIHGFSEDIFAERIELGKFKVISGKMIVTDPCYDMDTWCKEILENVKIGTWIADVYKMHSENRCAELVAYHSEYNKPPFTNMEILSTQIGVDSGQAGFFDVCAFKNDALVPKDVELTMDAGDGAWYDHCCTITLDTVGAGVIDGGVVSSSGYGDSQYNLYGIKDAEGQIVALSLVFIEDEDEEEDEYEED